MITFLKKEIPVKKQVGKEFQYFFVFLFVLNLNVDDESKKYFSMANRSKAYRN